MTHYLPPQSSAAEHGRCFATTRWSIVLAARQEDRAEAATALATLCETYWYPLYAYVRRCGYQAAEAQDLTQAYFARLLEKDDLRDVDRERGKFRSFLLASLKHFLANERDYRRAAKRGGGRPPLALDFATAEQQYQFQRADARTPEAEFDRQWAIALLDQVRSALQARWQAAGKGRQFQELSPCLTGDRSALSCQGAAERLGMSPGAVKVAIHRLRQQFGQLLRDQIAETVPSPEDVEDEIRQLFHTLRA